MTQTNALQLFELFAEMLTYRGFCNNYRHWCIAVNRPFAYYTSEFISRSTKPIHLTVHIEFDPGMVRKGGLACHVTPFNNSPSVQEPMQHKQALCYRLNEKRHILKNQPGQPSLCKISTEPDPYLSQKSLRFLHVKVSSWIPHTGRRTIRMFSTKGAGGGGEREREREREKERRGGICTSKTRTYFHLLYFIKFHKSRPSTRKNIWLNPVIFSDSDFLQETMLRETMTGNTVP